MRSFTSPSRIKKPVRPLSSPMTDFIMPAEWDRHEATWIGWPQNTADWPGKFTPIPWVFGEIARKITPGEILRILVNSARVEASARRVLISAGVQMEMVEFFRFPTNRGWTRDMGPIFVQARRGKATPESRRIAAFRFNAWAKYSNWQKDCNVPSKASAALGISTIQPMVGDKAMVLEGGSIDVNGRGTLLTTEECLLHPNIQVRNPGFSRRDYENAFSKYLGITNTIWLNCGIAGDDTHGHIDDLCRFVNANTIVLCGETNSNDANYQLLQENRERLSDAVLEDGSRPEVISLPMPSPVIFKGQRLPASYANFYIANSAVLVPTFNDPNDRIALGILSELFPSRQVVGIHAVDLVWGLGTIHCLTQQQPAANSPLR